jgi:hypothetical protein
VRRVAATSDEEQGQGEGSHAPSIARFAHAINEQSRQRRRVEEQPELVAALKSLGDAVDVR